MTCLRNEALRALSFLLVCLTTPLWAAAQGQGEDPAALAAFQVGPLALTPTFALRDVGVDTNVLGRPEGEADFTMTFVPGLDAWLRIGRLRLSSETELEWLYYRKTVSQRGFSVMETGKAELLLSYLTPYVSGTYDNTKRRQSAELDVRVRQRTTGWAGGVKVYPGARTDIGLEYRSERVRFDDEDLGGILLGASLDRDSEVAAFEVKYAVTALTRVVTRVMIEQDRFTRAAFRNSDSWSVLPGLEFRPSALVAGTAFVGYRKFETLDPTLPDFEGVVASVDLKYVARDMTKIQGLVSRNVEYSFEPEQPFYVQSEWRLELTQAITYDWDVKAQAGRTKLDYEQVAGAPLSGRVDYLWVYGGGIGRRFGIELRVGFDVAYTRRKSALPGRNYEGWRFGGSVTYGY